MENRGKERGIDRERKKDEQKRLYDLMIGKYVIISKLTLFDLLWAHLFT